MQVPVHFLSSSKVPNDRGVKKSNSLLYMYKIQKLFRNDPRNPISIDYISYIYLGCEIYL